MFTAEAMPEDRQIEGLILLSASISSAYDLDKALSHCRNGIVNFYNKQDSGVLGLGTTLIGTVDGTHGPSAGLIGFDCFDKPGYEGLYQVKMMGVSEDTHTTSTQVGFVSIHVTPWILAESWPAGPNDAYLDPPRPPIGGVQVARGPDRGGNRGKSSNRGKTAPAEPKNAAAHTPPPTSPRIPSDRTPPARDPDTNKNPTARPSGTPARTPASMPPALSKVPQDTHRPGPAAKLPPPVDPENEADLEPIAPAPAAKAHYKRW